MNSVIWEQLLTTGATALPLTIVDVETTGLNPHYGDRVCEVGIVRYQDGREVERFGALVNPGRSISPAAAAVNGITGDMLHDAQPFAGVADDVLRLLREGVTVAHNAPFDLAFLSREFALAKRPMPDTPVVDTLALARRCFSFPSNGLGNVAARLGIEGGGHRALADALTTHAVFERFVAMLASEERSITLGELLRLQGGAIAWPNPSELGEVPLPPGLGELVRDGRRLRLSYLSAAGSFTERWVDPIQVVARQGAAYLVAFCHLRQDQRTFKVDRIVRWEVG